MPLCLCVETLNGVLREIGVIVEFVAHRRLLFDGVILRLAHRTRVTAQPAPRA